MMRPTNLTLGLVVMTALAGCRASMQLTPNDADLVLAHQLLNAPNPGEPGSLRVRSMFYGSGTDRRRPEYRDSVSIKTETVDASKLVNLGESADERSGYWGFEPDEFPINGRVWYPEGDGPFPLVLIVHGNHNMREFSDPGYAYLGELLASRGYILTSVDENFVNGGIRGENDARGWLLLKHLSAWRDFNADRDNPFFGKVDLDRVALIGHSRGGEAVGHAAAFNTLSHYPDDASLEFDFNFGIQSVIAIAPVDGQYLPTGRRVPVENVNYMVFHGSHDADVTSFHGLRQYHRVRFTDGSPRFKAAVYVHRANHGQWNTVWGSYDSGGRRGSRVLDISALITPEEQRQFGKVYISAFLEATLKGDQRYLPIFRDHRVIGEWLPKTMFVTRFETNTFRPVATFEEDIDVTTGTKGGVTLEGDSLGTWREGKLALRSRNRANTSTSQENQAVWLGWNSRIAGEEDTTRLATPATYSVRLPGSLADAWDLSATTSLRFLLAPTNATPRPRRAALDSSASRDSRGGSGERGGGWSENEDDRPPIDLSVEVMDAHGTAARLPLSRYGPIRRPFEISILRRKDIERTRYPDKYDLVLQSYSLLLGDFVRNVPDLDLSRISEIRFVFDRAVAGTVVIDDIGFANLDPAFTSVMVGR